LKVIRTKEEMRRAVRRAQAEDRTVGLVPTMGFFHEGHLELMRRASECDVVVVSLFVNPTQFGEGEDFTDYPRDFDRDCAMAESVGVDYVFAPEPSEMYPEGFTTRVVVEKMSDLMCGAFRPGHFIGVATVVAKLFNIMPADRAYFGQKDAQQLAVIRAMARDLDFDIEIVGVPTVREEDGLAMSSRNTYLEADERAAATVLHRALDRASELAEKGERDPEELRRAVVDTIGAEPLARLEYVDICDNIYLRPTADLKGEILIALAVRIGRARLIDNVILRIE
jgi:pantoate--beta-alanine ligase